MKIEVEEVCLVRPEHSKPGRVLLSAGAHFAWEVQYRTRFVFFERFSSEEEGHFDAVVARLKTGLRKALDPFHPLAGRLRVRDDDLMELDCNGDGVMFIRASSDAALRELSYSDGDFQIPAEDLLGLAQTGGHVLGWPWASDAPLLFFQATRFACGGLCISIRFNHQAMDGTSAWHFWKSWAEACRGEAVSELPTWEHQPVKAQSRDDWLEIPPYLKLALKKSVLSASLEDPASYSTRCFVLDAQAIAELKRKKPGCTTFQVVSAHLWEKITRARQLGEETPTAMFFAVNCRKRLAMDPAYGGQGALIIGTSSIGAGLVGREGVELVRKTIHEFTEDKAKRFCEVVEMFAADAMRRVCSSWTSDDVLVGSSFHFPVYEDFGFGKPCGMAVIPTPNDGRVYYFPGRDEGSVAAYVSLRSEAMCRLISLMNH